MAEKRKNRKELYKDLFERLKTLDKGISAFERRLYGFSRRGVSAYPHLRKRGQKHRKNRFDRQGELTPLMARFVEEYPKDLNATKACIRAGFSKKSAHIRGCQLLKDPKIIVALKREYKAITKRNRIEQDAVLKEIALIAYSNILDFCHWTNDTLTLYDSKFLSRSDAACIKKVTKRITPKTTTISIDLYDKPSALMNLCRYLNILDGKDKDNKEDPHEIAQRLRQELMEIDNSIPKEPGEADDVYIPIAPNATLQERNFGKKLNELTDKQRSR